MNLTLDVRIGEPKMTDPIPYCDDHGKEVKANRTKVFHSTWSDITTIEDLRRSLLEHRQEK